MTSVADQFTEEQIQEMKEAFNMFDRNSDGTVHNLQLVQLFRILGIHVTEAELKDQIEENFEDEGSFTDFPEFLTLVSKTISKSKSKEGLLEAFRVFDKTDDGFIAGEEIKAIMMSMGDKLSEEEYQEMMAEMSDQDGNFDYHKFVKRVAKF